MWVTWWELAGNCFATCTAIQVLIIGCWRSHCRRWNLTIDWMTSWPLQLMSYNLVDAAKRCSSHVTPFYSWFSWWRQHFMSRSQPAGPAGNAIVLRLLGLWSCKFSKSGTFFCFDCVVYFRELRKKLIRTVYFVTGKPHVVWRLCDEIWRGELHWSWWVCL